MRKILMQFLLVLNQNAHFADNSGNFAEFPAAAPPLCTNMN